MNNQTTTSPPAWAISIKQMRLKLDESQEVFGKRYGVTKMAVSRWEAGINEPPAEVLVDALTRELS